MNFEKSKKMLIVLMAIYWIFTVGIYAIANEQFRYSPVTQSAPALEYAIGEVVDGASVSQTMVAPADLLSGIDILAGTYSRDNTGTLSVVLTDPAGVVVVSKEFDISLFQNGVYTTISFDQRIPVEAGSPLELTLSTQGCQPGNAVTIYANTVSVALNDGYCVSGNQIPGGLCIRLAGYNYLNFYRTYWILTVSLFLVAVIVCRIWWKGAKRGKSNPLVSLCTLYSRYMFLIKQLVVRDFKTKYKRSALGMAWSFMNPLLTMSVQYVVFSTLFKSNIPNYPVYLLTGIVFFTFFNEAVTMGMSSVTGNASLIKKVYMPKYIYPVSRILSSLVNFAFALMPLFLVMIATNTRFTPALFLLIFVIGCLLCFIIGMALLLTTAMTFFQDTQFLWGVACMMWQYMTPVFYPESIIPVSILPYYRLNPMYQYITFARTCIIDGVSPGPTSYLFCMLSAFVVLGLGILIFKKHQNKFVLYL